MFVLFCFFICAANSLEALIQPQIATTQVQLLFGKVTIYICWWKYISTVDTQ